MTYMGGKQKLAKYICPIINTFIKDNGITDFYDIMCGGANIIVNINCENLYANDLSPTLIALLQQAQDDFSQIEWNDKREEWDLCYTEYKRIRATDFTAESELPLARIGAIEWFGSYCGRGFPGGYGVVTRGRSAYDERYRNLKKQSEQPNFSKIKFSCGNYSDLNIPENALIYCFDKDTEIMTKDGWKYLKDVDIKTDTFLSRKPEGKQMDYLKATDYIHYPYKGKMVKYEGRQLDFCVTPNHKIFYNHKTGRAKIPQDGFMFAADFISKGDNYRFVKAGGIWEGKNPETYNLCGDVVDFKDLCYLLGIFITDGCINNQDNITISQTKPKIIEKIRDILGKMQLQYTEHCYKPDEGNITFYLSRRYIPFFKKFYKKELRRIPEEFKDATVPCLKKLLEGILDGDGQEGRKISTPTEGLVSDYQEIIYKIGLASNVSISPPKKSYYKKENRIIEATKPTFIVSILKTEYPPFYKKNVELIDYNDEVYCITLEKWHTVLIRRNGKTLWLGQCDPPYKGTKTYGINKGFDYEKFYNWLREKSKTNPIFISEQNMPDDFKEIWHKEVKRTLNKDEQGKKATEKLYFMDNRR